MDTEEILNKILGVTRPAVYAASSVGASYRCTGHEEILRDPATGISGAYSMAGRAAGERAEVFAQGINTLTEAFGELAIAGVTLGCRRMPESARTLATSAMTLR